MRGRDPASQKSRWARPRPLGGPPHLLGHGDPSYRARRPFLNCSRVSRARPRALAGRAATTECTRAPRASRNLSPRSDRHTKRGVKVRKDTKRSDRVDFKAYPFRGLTTKKSGSGAFNWGNMPSPDDLLEWEHEVGSMHSDDEEDPGDEGYFLGRPLEAFVSDDEENSRDALGAALAPDDAKTRARRGAPEGESMALDDVFLDRERAQSGRGADDDARAAVRARCSSCTRRSARRARARGRRVRARCSRTSRSPCRVGARARAQAPRGTRRRARRAPRARRDAELPDDSEPVPLSELSVLELYATKRAPSASSRPPSSCACSRTSEPVPEWVPRPERKLQAEIRNVVGAPARARARCPPTPASSSTPASSTRTSSSATPRRRARSSAAADRAGARPTAARGGNKPLRKARRAGDDGGDGGRRPPRAAAARGSKRAAAARTTGATRSRDAARGRAGELADDDDDEPLLTVDEVLAPPRARAHHGARRRDRERARGRRRTPRRAPRRGANRGADAPIRPRPPLQAMRVVELYARKRMLTKGARGGRVRPQDHAQEPAGAQVGARARGGPARRDPPREARAPRPRDRAADRAGRARSGRARPPPAPREETPPATPPAPPSSPKARRDSPAPTACPRSRARCLHKEQRRVKKLLVLLEYRKTTTDDAEKAEKAAADMAAEIAALEAKALKRAAARGRQGDDRNYLAALEKAA